LIAVLNSASAQTPAPPLPTDHANLLQYTDGDGRTRPVQTKDDWAMRRRQIVLGMEQAMGPLPDLKAAGPLDVQLGPAQPGEGFTKRTLSYLAEPGDRVTADLYLPEGLKPGEKRAAILALHPTSNLGKDVVAGLGPRPNRAYAVELAQRGYVVLAPDYPSFGGLSKYDFAADRYESGTMKAIVNHIRGVDLLVARPEVDPARLGTIGHSLGGHNAMFVGVFDERLKAIVSSCGWTPFHDYYNGKIAGWTSDRYMPKLRDVYKLDPNQVPFDFYEVVAALAPRAFFSCSPLRDSNFDVIGVKKAIPRAQAIYTLLGAEDRLQVRYPDSEHDFPTETRRESYQFLDCILQHTPSRDVPPLDSK